MSEHATELQRGERFGFGDNWAKFLSRVDQRRVDAAMKSLEAMLGVGALRGRRFLDAGSGSGLSSLAARSLGAVVHSFDYDPRSVACTRELRERFRPGDTGWTIEEGSVLDTGYLGNLGRFDIVYSWGVLHHTGAMWQAIENLTQRLAEPGQLWIAIYNDQGRASVRWKRIKRAYCKAPALRPLIVAAAFARLWGPTTVRDLFTGRLGSSWRRYEQEHERGMSPWRDVIDWVGGYPFEVARPEEIFDFLRTRGLRLSRLSTCAGGIGCNEYVFSRGKA